MSQSKKTGVILLNTGSAASPHVPDVREYLSQFLSDPRIIDIPAWQRWIIVNCFILPVEFLFNVAFEINNFTRTFIL